MSRLPWRNRLRCLNLPPACKELMASVSFFDALFSRVLALGGWPLAE